MTHFWKILGFLMLLIGFWGVAGHGAEEKTLRVGLLENARLASLPSAEIEAILEATTTLAREQYGMDIAFHVVGRKPVATFFSTYETAMMNRFRLYEYIREISMESREDLFRSLILEYSGTPFPDLKAFAIRAEPDLDSMDLENKGTLLRKVAEIHLKKLMDLQAHSLPDGKALLEDNLYHQFMAWHALLQNQEDYEVILTNQILASVETFHPEIHGSLRGGVATGFVAPSPNPYGGAVLVSLFPIISDLEIFTRHRETAYGKREIREACSFMLMHELLHLLDFRKHHFDHQGCLMNPAPGFQYLEWAREIQHHGFCQKDHPDSPYLSSRFNAFKTESP